MTGRALLLRNVFPLVMTWVVWAGLVLVRWLPPLDFDPLHAGTVFYCLIFLLALSLGFLVGVGLADATTPPHRPDSRLSDRQISRFVQVAVAVSLISFGLAIADDLAFLLDGGLSVARLTEARLEKARDAGYEIGASWVGVIATITSAAFIVCIMIRLRLYDRLSPAQKRLLSGVFVVGILLTFLGGGRNSAIIAVLFAAFIFVHDQIDRTGKVPLRIFRFSSTTVSMLIGTALVFYVFSLIFIERAQASYGEGLLIWYLDRSLFDSELTSASKVVIESSAGLRPIFFVVSLFQYYIGHGVNQLEVFLDSPMPLDAPYFLAYQLYSFSTLLNKFGFDIISVGEILNQIPRKGVYITLVGAFLMDFGRVGGIVASLFYGIYCGFCWCKFLRNGQLIWAFWSALNCVVLSFSPILGLIGTGLFPSLFLMNIIVIPFSLLGRKTTASQRERVFVAQG